jgi:hypothetical protein
MGVLSFSDDASYSGPGPFNAFVLVMNTGTAVATDVVLAFEVVEGGEFFHEAVFGNGQLWWAHGAPDAGVIYVVPRVAAGGNAGVRFVATMPGPPQRAEWSGAAQTVIRVSVVGGECVEAVADGSSGDEAFLTFSATGNGEAPTPAAEPPVAPTAGVTPTLAPVSTAGVGAEGVSTVLGAEEAPTGAPRPSATSVGATAPTGEILPEGGEGSGGDSVASAAVVLAGVAIAVLFLGIGVVVGRVAPR